VGFDDELPRCFPAGARASSLPEFSIEAAIVGVPFGDVHGPATSHGARIARTDPDEAA
jgi:hypothetical protein